MPTIGVRELRRNASKVLDEVSANGEVLEIIRHGRVIAKLVPAGDALTRTGAGIEPIWTDLDRSAFVDLRAEIMRMRHKPHI